MTILKRNLIRIYRKHRSDVIDVLAAVLIVSPLVRYFIDGVLARL